MLFLQFSAGGLHDWGILLVIHLEFQEIKHQPFSMTQPKNFAHRATGEHLMENEMVDPQKEKNRFSKAELLETVMNLIQSRKTRLEIQEELGLTKGKFEKVLGSLLSKGKLTREDSEFFLKTGSAYAKSFPEEIQSLLKVSGNDLIFFTIDNGNIVLKTK